MISSTQAHLISVVWGSLLSYNMLMKTKGKRDSSYDVFDLFDLKCDGVIDFGEFVRSLSVFHPNTSQDEKIAFAFRLYDLRNTGFIEREELKELVLDFLNESNLYLSDDIIDTIVDQTYKLVDANSDGKIDPIEWKEFVLKNPSLLKNMTLPYLKDIPTALPSFVMKSEVDEEDVD